MQENCADYNEQYQKTVEDYADSQKQWIIRL